MRNQALENVIAKVNGMGRAQEALEAVQSRFEEELAGDFPELPDNAPEDAGGPPDAVPPADRPDFPGFDDATGLPLVAMAHLPEPDPADEALDAATFLF